ncbi:DUF2075 domain-containing protein [Chryseobacterium daecheongense]|uniref:DUF2075 domain-containing protein n=1 Tax=Chryseobacterium daecheongense TaxID=192389 RepID=A0A3N0W579_9FLAO|nr:DUF2075 domain-containing protein [Chryseobacterium daecheongense]ROI00224.1 DUF2075 domain-containing protein [Chryseobacterium daecheongense]TDX94819.1 hypothetical protein BCF50_0590 [Chryseobacterium daecheongense]
MIVYHKTKQDFSSDVLTNAIENIISSQIHLKTGHNISARELRSFHNSLGYMDRVLNDPQIPEDAGISIEYHIPQTSKRVDFIITGRDDDHENVIIIELKQWESCQLTDRDGIIQTRLGGGMVDTSHPSYQAYSYAALLNGFNATIEEENIRLHPCAYLHNYEPDGIIDHTFYEFYNRKAPVFLKPDALKLREFIKRFIKKGDNSSIMFRIDNGKVRPTKSLSDALNSILKGNKEFLMIDDQKVVYETAKKIAIESSESNKNVIIVQGGAGTGKSVVAINLLVDLVKRGHLAQYVTKTSAPREVYFDKLSKDLKMVELKKLFVGSGSFINTPLNSFKTLLVDEAHRLTEKTSFLRRGDNQVKEIINSALCSIFFIDEDQRVHIEDYGEIKVIEEIALQLGANVHKMELESQFRCNGSDGYISWLDNTLQIRETANYEFNSKDFDYEFKIFDSPDELKDTIVKKNKKNNKARLVAGYCWDWVSDKNPELDDIKIDGFDFSMKWNLKTYGSTWIINPNSVNEVGCIHTCQGLEVDYIGVIIGDDLIVRDDQVLVQPLSRSKMDKSIFGYKKLLKENPQYAKSLVRSIIKNTYRTLMTRGMKGCYIYCTDHETREYFKKALQS